MLDILNTLWQQVLLDKNVALCPAGLLGTSGYDDLTLLRWLRAESGSVDKAEKRLMAHAQWRATFVPNGVISEVRPPGRSQLSHPLNGSLWCLAGHVPQGLTSVASCTVPEM